MYSDVHLSCLKLVETEYSVLAREQLLKWTTALVWMEAWECASHPPSVLTSRTTVMRISPSSGEGLQTGRGSWRSLSQAIYRLSRCCQEHVVFSSEYECLTDNAETSLLGVIWSCWCCTRLRIASVSGEVLLVVVLVGKLKARAGQAVQFFLGLLHAVFRLVLAGGQVTSATWNVQQ